MTIIDIVINKDIVLFKDIHFHYVSRSTLQRNKITDSFILSFILLFLVIVICSLPETLVGTGDIMQSQTDLIFALMKVGMLNKLSKVCEVLECIAYNGSLIT